MWKIKDILLIPYENDSVILPKNIYFNRNGSSIIVDEIDKLEKITTLLKENKNIDIEITGHVENSSWEMNNTTLARDRAHSVFNYFIRQGINRQRLIKKDYSENAPDSDNDTEEVIKNDRRVKINISTK